MRKSILNPQKWMLFLRCGINILFLFCTYYVSNAQCDNTLSTVIVDLSASADAIDVVTIGGAAVENMKCCDSQASNQECQILSILLNPDSEGIDIVFNGPNQCVIDIYNTITCPVGTSQGICEPLCLAGGSTDILLCKSGSFQEVDVTVTARPAPVVSSFIGVEDCSNTLNVDGITGSIDWTCTSQIDDGNNILNYLDCGSGPGVDIICANPSFNYTGPTITDCNGKTLIYCVQAPATDCSPAQDVTANVILYPSITNTDVEYNCSADNSSITLMVTSSSSCANLEYQWVDNADNPIMGATSSSLTVSPDDNMYCVDISYPMQNGCPAVRVCGTASLSNCCISNAGDLSSATALTGFPAITVCSGEDAEDDMGNPLVITTNSTPPTMDYQYMFLLSDANGTIIQSNSDGDFDFSTLSSGDYNICGLSYANSNIPASISTYINNISMDMDNDDVSQITGDESTFCLDINCTVVGGMPISISIETTPTISLSSGPSCAGDLMSYSLTVSTTAASTISTSTTSMSETIVDNMDGTFTVSGIDIDDDIVIVAENANCNSTGLDVSAPDCACPTIDPSSMMPISEEICEGDAIPTLSVSDPGVGFTINWYVSTTGTTLVSGATLSGTSNESILLSTSSNPSIPSPTGNVTIYAEVEQDISGCTSSTRTPVTLTIHPNPAPTIISTYTGTNSNMDAICAEDIGTPQGTLTLDAGSGYSMYAWSTTETPQTIQVNPSAPSSTYTVTVTDANSCTAEDEITITVNNSPSASIMVTENSVTPNDGLICGGEEVTLSASGGSTYQWSANVGTPSDVSTVMVNPTLNTTYTVTVTNADGCTSEESVDITLINSPNQPIITPSSLSLCLGDIITLETQVYAGTVVNYYWDWMLSTNSPIPILSADGNIITSGTLNTNSINAQPTESGTYVYTLYVNVDGCVSETAQIEILVYEHAMPILTSNLGTSIECQEGNETLTISVTQGFDSYSWSGPDSFTSTMQEAVIDNVTSINSGTYFVTVTDNNGCTGVGSIDIAISDQLPDPTVMGSTVIGINCAETLTSNIPQNGNIIYNWSVSPTGAATIINNNDGTATITGFTSGIVNVMLEVTEIHNSPLHFCNKTTSFAVEVNPEPVIYAPLLVCSSLPSFFIDVTSVNTSDNTLASPFDNDADPATIESVAWLNGATGEIIPTAADYPGGTVTVWYHYSETASPSCINSTSFTFYDETFANDVSLVNCALTPGATTTEIDLNDALDPFSSTNVFNVDADISGDASTNGLNASFYNSIVDANAANNPISSIVSATDGQEYYIRLEHPSSFSCFSIAKITVSIGNSPAVAASSNSPVCLGTTINLMETEGDAIAWSWSGPNGFTSNSQNPSITATSTSAGIYTVTVMNADGCTNEEEVSVVLSNPIGTGGDFTLCEDNPAIELNGLIPVGATGFWSYVSGGNGGMFDTSNGISFGSTLNGPNIDDTYSINLLPSFDYAMPIILALNINATADCPAYDETLTIYVDETVQVTTPSTINTCHDDVFTISGTVSGGSFSSGNAIPSVSSGTWSTSGDGTFSDEITVSSTVYSDYTPGPNDIAAGTVTLTLSANDPNNTCIANSSSTIVTIESEIMVEAGTYPSICASDLPLALEGVVTQGMAVMNPSTNITWSGGAGSFSDVNDLNSTYTPTPAEIAFGTVTLMLTYDDPSDACPSENDEVTLTFINEAIPFTNTYAPVCSDDPSISLNGMVNGIISTGTWSGAGTFVTSGTSTTTNLLDIYMPTATEISDGMATLTLTADAVGICPPIAAMTTIIINDAATADAGADLTICEGDVINLSGTIGGGAMMGQWEVISGSSTLTSTGMTIGTSSANPVNDSYTPTALDIAKGVVEFHLVAEDPDGADACGQVYDTLIVTINPIAAVNAGGDQTICEGEVALLDATLTGAATSGTWSGGMGVFSNVNSPTSTYTAVASEIGTTVTLTWTSDDPDGAGPCMISTDEVDIAINQAPTVSVTPSSTTVCSDLSPVALNGTVGGVVGVFGQWTTVDGTGTFGSTSSMGSGNLMAGPSIMDTYTPSAADVASGSVVVQLVTNDIDGAGPCEVQTVDFTIVFEPFVDAGPNIGICDMGSSGFVTLNSATVSGATSISWSAPAGSGVFASTSTNTSTTLVDNFTPASLTAGSTISLTLTVSHATCSDYSDNLDIVISDDAGTTATANVLTAGPICSDQEVQLAGSFSGAASSASWTTNGGGTFSPSANDLNAIYTPSITDNGVITFTLTTTDPDGDCMPAMATTMITINDDDVVEAGNDIEVCESNPVATLRGIVNGTTMGSSTDWVWSGGAGVFSDVNDLQSTYTLDAAENVVGNTIILTLTNMDGVCTNSDEVTITVTGQAIASMGSDVAVCTDDPNATVVAFPSGSANSGSWATSGDGTFMPSANVDNPTYVPGTNDLAGAFPNVITLSYTTNQNGECPQVTGMLNYTIYQEVTIDAGLGATVCSNNPTATIAGMITGGASLGTWRSVTDNDPTNDGTFGTMNMVDVDGNFSRTIANSYTLSPFEVALGYATLRLTSDDPDPSPCNEVFDEITIMVDPAAMAFIDDSEIVICEDNPTVDVVAEVSGTATTGTWTTSGTGSFSAVTTTAGTPTTVSATYNLSATDITNGIIGTPITLTFTTDTPAGPCGPDVAQATIYVDPVAVADAGEDQTMCSDQNIALDGTVSGSATSGIWSSSGTGTFTSMSVTPTGSGFFSVSTIYTPSSADSTAGSVVLTLTTNDPDNPCDAVSDDITLTIEAAPYAEIMSSNDVICSNEGTVALTATLYGTAVSGYWKCDNCTGSFNDYTALSAIYTMGATDAIGTVLEFEFVVDEPIGACDAYITPIYLVEIVSSPVIMTILPEKICEGDAVQLITTTTNGLAPFTYNWSPNTNIDDNTLAQPTVSPLVSTTYMVTVTDANACTGVNTVLVNVDPKPTGTIAIADVIDPSSCAGTDGAIIIRNLVANDTFYVDYTFNGILTQTACIATTNTDSILIGNLAAGEYEDFVITNCQTGCVGDRIEGPFFLNDPSLDVPVFGDMSNPTACGLSDGSIIIAGLTSDDSYNVCYTTDGVLQNAGTFVSSNNSIIVPNLGANILYDDFLIKGIESNCTVALSGSFTLQDTFQAMLTDTILYVCEEGTITLNTVIEPSDPMSTLVYEWSHTNGFFSNATNPVIDPVSPQDTGVYTLVVYENGCASNPASVTVRTNEAPDVMTLDNITICLDNQTDLDLQATVSGDMPPYSYRWEGPNGFISMVKDTTLLATDLDGNNNSGIYTITVTDDNGCFASSSIEVILSSRPNNPNLTASTIDVCANEEVIISSSTYSGQTLEYYWDTTGATPPATFISTNSNELSLTPTDTITVAMYVSVDGCISDTSYITINAQPFEGMPMLTFTNPTGCGLTDGTITISGLTGTDYDISYDYNGIQEDLVDVDTTSLGEIVLTNFAAGIYDEFRLTDANGCTYALNDVLILVEPNAPSVSVSSNSPICLDGLTDLMLSSTVTGGTAPFTYAWSHSNGYTSSDENPVRLANTLDANADAGTYTLVVTDDNTCSATASIDITLSNPPADPTLSASAIDVCADEEVVISTSTTYSGNMVSYYWDTTGVLPPVSFEATNSNQLTIYPTDTVTVAMYVSVDGCISDTAYITINAQAFEGSPSLLDADPSGCGLTNGSIVITGLTGMSYDVSYDYNGEQQDLIDVASTGTITLSNLSSGIYDEFRLTDANGCSIALNDVITLVEPDAPSLTLSSNGPICLDNTDNLELSSMVSGGTAPYTYAWSHPNGYTSTDENPVRSSNSLDAMADAGTYTLVVTDDNGCSATAAIEVTLTNPPVDPTLTADNTVVCAGDEVTITSNVYTGTSVTYFWNDGSGIIISSSNEYTFTPTSSTTVRLSVVVDGCTSRTAILPIGTDTFAETVSIASNINPSDCGGADGMIMIDGLIDGDIYDVSYTYNNGTVQIVDNLIASGGMIQLSDLSAGSFENIILSNANGCSSITALAANLSDPGFANTAMIEVEGMPTTTCDGDDGMVSISGLVSGEVYEVSYSYDGGALQTLSNLIASDGEIFFSGPSGMYTNFMLTDNSGCQMSLAGSAMVTQNSFIGNPIISNQATSACDGTDGMIIISGLSSGHTYQVSYSYNNQPLTTVTNLVGSSLGDLFIQNLAAGFYTNISLIDENACESMSYTETIQDASFSTSGIQVLGSDPSSCGGEDGYIAISGLTNGASYEVNYTANGVYQSTGALAAFIGGAIQIQNLEAGVIYTNFEIIELNTDCSANVDQLVLLSDPTPPTALDPTAVIAVCEGDAIFFEVITPLSGMPADAVFEWIGPDGFISTDLEPIITDAAIDDAGMYMLTITVDDCTSAPSMVEVVVNEVPETPSIVLSNFNTICDGDAIFLSTSSNCETYQWIGPDGDSPSTLNNQFLTTSDNSTVIPSFHPAYEGGMWSVICINESGCATQSIDQVEIVINPVPDIPLPSSNGDICEGETISLFPGTVNHPDATYIWYDGNPQDVSSSIISTEYSPNIDNLDAASYEYWLVVEINSCRSDANMVSFDVNDLPSVSATNNGGNCGTILELSATPTDPDATYSYAWNGPNNFSSTEQNPVITQPDEDNIGTYSVIITNENNCQSEVAITQVDAVDEVTVTPTIDAVDYTLCEGEEIQLVTDIIDGDAVSYTWTIISDGTYNFTTNEPFFNISTTTNAANDGNYYVVANVDGCESAPSELLPITVFATPETPDLPPTAIYCEGDMIQFNAALDPEASYFWSGPGGFTSDIHNPSIENAQLNNSGAYSLYVEINGCSSEVANMGLTVNNLPDEVVITNDSPVCEDGEINLVVANPDQNSIYIWRDENGAIVGGGTLLTISDATVADAGNYYIQVTENGCTYNALQDVEADGGITTVEVTPHITFAADAGPDDSTCEEVYQLNGSLLPLSSSASSQWDDMGSTTTIVDATDPSAQVQNLQAGDNTFIYQIDNGVCGVESQDTVVITYAGSPIALDDEYILNFNEGLTFFPLDNDFVLSPYHYLFDNSSPLNGEMNVNADGTFTYVPDPSFSGTDGFSYTVCNELCPGDCAEAFVTIIVEANRECVAPTVITPNGDGLNDSFIVPCLGYYPNSSIIFFNRWGDEVYRSDNYQNDWQGTYNNVDLPVGTYFYILSVNDGNDTKLQGYVYIQRE